MHRPRQKHEGASVNFIKIGMALRMASSTHLTSPFLEKSDPDKYGQCHPIETPVLVQTSFILLNEELEKLSGDEKEAYLKAVEMCPNIVTSDDHKILFLRCEQYNVDMAARRLCKYWIRRLQILGSTAFLPLTSIYVENNTAYIGIGTGQLQNHSLNVTKDEEETSAVTELVSALSLGFLSPITSSKPSDKADRPANVSVSIAQALALGFMQVLPGHDDQGRALIWIEPRKLEGSYSRESILNSIWFLLHSALQIIEETQLEPRPNEFNADPQKRGIVFLIYLRDADPFRHFDVSLVQRCAESIRGALPVRVSAIHFLEPPLLFDALYEVVQLILGDLLKKRIHVHSYRWGSKYEVSVWERFGISLKSLPIEIGGATTLDPQDWMKHRGFDSIGESTKTEDSKTADI